MHRTNLFISQNVSIDDVLLHRISCSWWKSVLNHSAGSTRKWVPERIFQRSYEFHLATCHGNTCASLLLQKSFLSSLQRVFNTIRKVNVNCSLEIFRTFSCFAASTAHQDRNRTKTGSINMTAPQHHIEPTFSTHPTVDNFEANMFHFRSRLAVNYDHNLLEKKKQLSLLWTWPLCCSIPQQNIAKQRLGVSLSTASF